MTLTHPTIKKIISDAQLQIRELTGNNSIILLTTCLDDVSAEFNELVEIICSVTGVDFDTATQKCRNMKERRTRQLIAYYAYSCCNMTNKLIGEKLGGKHHTTILSARAKIQDLIESNDAEVCRYVKRVNELLQIKYLKDHEQNTQDKNVNTLLSGGDGWQEAIRIPVQ